MHRLCWLLVVCPTQALGATLLYDVDFGSPPNVVGQPPAVGAGTYPRATPNDI